MGSSNNHKYDIEIKEGSFKSLLGKKGIKIKEIHEILINKYGLELKYTSFNNIINNRVKWKLIYASIISDYFEVRISDLFRPVKNKDYIIKDNEVVDEDNELDEIPKRIIVKFSKITRSLSKSTRLKILYDYKCQICGTRIHINKFVKYAESHHMHQLGHPHNGVDELENMIIVCPNHHKMFDRGAIAIHPDSLELYGIDIDKNIIIKLIDAKQIMFNANHSIRKEYLLYHWENIFLPNANNHFQKKFKNKLVKIKRSVLYGV